MSALAGEQDRFLVQPVARRTAAEAEQRRDLLGEPRLDRFRLAAGRGFRARRERGDLVEPRRRAGGRALRLRVAPHGEQIGERLIEAGDDRGFGGAAIFLALVLLGDLDHAFEREDTVERRRRRLDRAAQVLHRREHRRQHRLVDAHGGRHAFSFDGEIGVDRAARQLFGCARARRHLDRIPARRQAQAQIEALGVDRFELPAQA